MGRELDTHDFTHHGHANRPPDPEPLPVATSTKGPLPDSAAERKKYPIWRGAMRYFPDAIAYVSHVSWVGNEQHNPGEEMHWARGKSNDQEDCIARHLLQAGTMDDDGLLHTGKLAWRALALLQLELEGGR